MDRIFSEEISDNFTNLRLCDNISLEDAQALVERVLMRRKEILSHYEVKQLPSGRYWARVNDRVIKKKTKEEVEEAIIKELTAIPTVDAIFPNYLSIRRLEVGQTTWIKDKYYYETYISPLIGKRNVHRLTIDDGYRFLEGCIRIHPGMTRKYWGNLRCMLNQFFQYCIDRRYIDQNPWISMKPKKDLFAPPKFTRDGDTVFTKTEQIAVCDLAKKEAVRTRRSEPLGIVLLFNLGLRDGELCALKWGDMERTTTHEYIHVQREMVSNVTEDGKAKGVTILSHCKTPAGDRRLLLNAEAKETLKQIRQYNQDRGIPCMSDDFVFLRVRKGNIEHITTRSIDSRLRRYCRETGMKVEKSPHDIRRTVLTNLYHAGMPLKKVQEFAGHSSMKQTMDYIRVSDDDIDTMQFIESLSAAKTPADNIVKFRREA